MRCRGFTLLELIIVIVLLGISSVFSMRFIADMATAQVNNTERAQALAGARFMMERLRRELSLAYSPSVYLDEPDEQQQCVAFVPVIGAGRYVGVLNSETAQFILPVAQHYQEIKNTNLAINTPENNSVNQWLEYPKQPLPDGVAQLQDQNSEYDNTLPWTQAFGDLEPQPDFTHSSNDGRYTLLKRQQVRFCLNKQGEITRQLKEEGNWTSGVLMLSNVKYHEPFFKYHIGHQLLTVNLAVQTTDGVLALPSQMQVNYAP